MHIDWRPYAGGLVLGGFIGAEAIVGICGPHPNGLYSLTFYRSPVERRWELFVASEAKAQATAERVLGIWERRRERGRTRAVSDSAVGR